MKIIIKTMETPEEIEGKSLVHWQTWREAYDDLLPEEFQETMTFQVGEIIALYVLKDYYGKGVSEQLMHAAFDVLNHFSEIYLWVLKDNKRAVAFYQKMGFSFDGQEKILKLGKPVKELRMVCSSNKNS